MKRVLFLIILFATASLSYGDGKCPENKYFDPISKKCITPGDDPSGVTDWEFRRQLIEEGQGFCKKGWCCPDKAVFDRCLRSGDKEEVGNCKGCFRYDK